LLFAAGGEVSVAVEDQGCGAVVPGELFCWDAELVVRDCGHIDACAFDVDATRAADAEAPILTGNDTVDAFLQQLETDPQNDILRISLARIGWQIGIPDLAVQQYKYLIKYNRSLDQVVDEINDLLLDSDEQKLTYRLHRTLGDVYTKQGRFREAIEEYSWTGGGPRSTR
jgi:tetratricopeptide (TPR) repeat protein